MSHKKHATKNILVFIMFCIITDVVLHSSMIIAYIVHDTKSPYIPCEGLEIKTKIEPLSRNGGFVSEIRL